MKRQQLSTLFLIGNFVVFRVALPTIDSGEIKNAGVKLNQAAFDHARELIKEGSVVLDNKNEWSEHQPSAEEENEFIRLHGFDEYAKWHLGIDERHAENTKARYKFPYGDFRNVHRCALLAAKSRAVQYKYREIENAADQLAGLIGMKKKLQEKQ
jgi:hypothetical protein